MLLDLGKAVSFATSLLSLCALLDSAFFIPATRWEDRLVACVARIGFAGSVCLISGLLFHLSQPRVPLARTLPVRLFLYLTEKKPFSQIVRNRILLLTKLKRRPLKQHMLQPELQAERRHLPTRTRHTNILNLLRPKGYLKQKCIKPAHWHIKPRPLNQLLKR